MGKIGFISITSALVLVTLIPLLDVQGGHGMNADPTRGGLEDAFEFYLQSFSTTRRPGESESFYMNVYNDYDGSSYGGSIIPLNRSELKEVKVFFTGFFNEDMDPLTGGPVDWVVSTIYNNNGDGYTISQYNSLNFYADDMANYLEFTIKTTGITPGNYYLGYRVDFRYMVDWDGATQYDWASSSQAFMRPLEIRSHIEGSGYPEYNFYAFNENFNTDTIYAGATNKLFGIQSLYSPSASISDVSIDIDFPDSTITARNPMIVSPTLPSTMTWRIDIPQNLPPGEYLVGLTFSYSRNGESIQEGVTMHHFTVHYSPLLFSPPSDDLTDPFMTFSRNSLPSSIDVPFSNGGNVNLTDVMVRLDLDNSRYIGDGNYYINEDSYGNAMHEGIEETIPSIPVGESRTATFEVLDFLPRLPPGRYKIPIDYQAMYEDDGSTGNPSGQKVAGHWYEKNRYEHRNIMRDISYPEDSSSDFYLFLLIEIIPDQDGFLIDAFVDYNYNQAPGTQNAYMRLYVSNYEMFSFKNLIYRIHVDEGSPFTLPYSEMNFSGSTLAPILRGGIGASSGTNTASDSFYFYAGIRMDAPPGINYFKVDISGYTEYNQPFNMTILAHISISTHQPRFESVTVEVGDILADRSVAITVDVMNFGLGGANNLSCFFRSSSSGYVGIDDPVSVGDVRAGDSFIYTFHVNPDSTNRYFNGNYAGNVYFAYYDDLGNFMQMFSGNNMQVRYDLYDKLPDIEVLKVEAPLVDRGDKFNVKITIMNIGGSGTTDLKVLLPHDTTQFIVEDPEKELTDLEPGDTLEFTFTTKALKEISDYTTYSFMMRFSFIDVMGRERTFTDGDSEYFYIRTKDRIIPSEQNQVIKDDGQLVSAGAGNVILGLLIIVAVIVFAVMFKGGSKVEITNVRPDEKEAPVKAKKIELEEDDEEDEEEDDIVDEEEEEDEMKEDEEMAW